MVSLIDPEEVQQCLHRLDDWLDQSEWRGFDPYDIKSLAWVRSLTAAGNKYKLFEILREILFEIFLLKPKSSRALLRVKPQQNAKGLALLSEAYLDLYQISNDPAYLEKSTRAREWLEKNSIELNGGIGWGYPFDWQSKEFIPAYTPNGIVTTAAGAAFWSWYEYSGETKFLDICHQIATFLVALPKKFFPGNQCCFAYTPIFQNYVHNLNLFIAEFLLKVGLETENESFTKLAKQAINYTVSDQLPSGAFDYEGPPVPRKNHVDNYHTGYVLRMLYSIWKITHDSEIKACLDRCYDHYLANFFDEGRPRFKPDRKFPIDIHSVSETIICLSELSETYPQGREQVEKTLDFAIKELQDANGYFYHGIFKSRLLLGSTFKSKIAHFRWAEGWMLKALSTYLTYQGTPSSAVKI